MRTVLFTGAGASRAIGYPLTGELLPRVRDEIADGSLFQGLTTRQRGKVDRADLKRLLLRLYPGFEDVPREELPLITDVFSLAEYAIVNGEALPIGGLDAVHRFLALLKQAITDILLGDWLEDWGDTPEQSRQQATLAALTAWMKRPESDVALVTTNYDIGIDTELYGEDKRRVYATIDLGCDWRHIGTGHERTRPSDDPRLRVYKLHGSLDQLRCASCGYVYFNPWGTIAHQVFRTTLDDHNTCHCRDDLRLELNIVAPSFVREIRDANLLNVWRSAMEWMRTAGRWVIVGYSLPSEDLAIRSLLMRAYAGAERKPEITVVQVGTSAEARYKVMFPDCIYRSDGLEGYLGL